MPRKSGKILIVDDEEDVLLAARLFLKQHFSLIHTEQNPQKIQQYIQNENYDIILLDINFPIELANNTDGFYWLDQILKSDPRAVVIMITAYGDVEMAVRAIKAGATDFILKPWQNEKLLATISSALSLRFSRLEIDKLRSQKKQLNSDIDKRYHEIIGNSSAMKKVFTTIDKVAQTDANVLILGENGTGKELIARALHRQSKRFNEVFSSVDMGSISESLFESELFGYMKGAFTDAKENRPGRFELASGGSLFLDEIGNLSFQMQAKLLSFLETRKVIRLGSNKKRDIDIRLICATNKPLLEMVKRNEFRQDLLYRINTVEIQLPPLRERPEDIHLFVNHYVTLFSKKYNKDIKGVHSTAISKLTKYNWPGNVRELKHTLERAVILSESPMLKVSDFFLPQTDIQENGLIFNSFNLEEIEKIIIRKVLTKTNGNITQTAKELGLTRTSLYRRMEKYGL